FRRLSPYGLPSHTSASAAMRPFRTRISGDHTMSFCSVRNSVRPAAPSTLLRVEKLDDRVMPSFGVALSNSVPVEAPGSGAVQINSESLWGEGKKVKIDLTGAFSIDILAHAQAKGASLGVVFNTITRSSGEEIPQ